MGDRTRCSRGNVDAVSSATGGGSMFAAAGANIYDVTSGRCSWRGRCSGLTNARWRYIDFAVGGTSYLYAVNGADNPRPYNGVAWTAIDGVSVPAVTGVTTTNLVNINVPSLESGSSDPGHSRHGICRRIRWAALSLLSTCPGYAFAAAI